MKLLPAVALALSVAVSPAALAQAPAAGGAAQLEWYSHQPDELRASKLLNTSVKNNAGETIGDVNEVVLSKDGKVVALVIGAGGFLGIGEHNVAVEFSSLRLAKDEKGNTIATLNADKNMIKSAPEWKWSTEDQTGTSGIGTPPAKQQ